jgi:hypothetical protein
LLPPAAPAGGQLKVLVLAFKFAAKMVDVDLQQPIECPAAGMHRGRYRALFHEGISRHG